MAPPTKDKPVFREFVTKDGAGKDLGLLTATLEQALRSVREYLSAKVVLYDQRGKLLDGLYMGLPAGANAVSPGMELDMNDLEEIDVDPLDLTAPPRLQNFCVTSPKAKCLLSAGDEARVDLVSYCSYKQFAKYCLQCGTSAFVAVSNVEEKEGRLVAFIEDIDLQPFQP